MRTATQKANLFSVLAPDRRRAVADAHRHRCFACRAKERPITNEPRSFAGVLLCVFCFKRNSILRITFQPAVRFFVHSAELRKGMIRKSPLRISAPQRFVLCSVLADEIAGRSQCVENNLVSCFPIIRVVHAGTVKRTHSPRGGRLGKKMTPHSFDPACPFN